MKKAKIIVRKVLSVFLTVLMVLTAWVWVAPSEVSAANKYYVKVYVNIYDGSDGYGGAYSVEESTGKPKNYSWATNDGWYGRINMTGFTVFGENGDYDAQDVSAALLEAEKLNTYYAMDGLSNDNANGDWDSKAIAKAEYTFVLDSFPVEIFWMNDENNWDGGNTGFAIRKLTVATSENGTEHTMWEGLAGSDSETYNYYGSITPTGIHTCFEDYAKNYNMDNYKFYKAITTSSQRAWSDPYKSGSVGTYYLNEYANGGLSTSFSEGVESIKYNIDYINTGSTDTYFMNVINHSATQAAKITAINNVNSFVESPVGVTIPAGGMKSFKLKNISSLGGDGAVANFAYTYTLENVYASDAINASLAVFYQPCFIGLWNENNYSSEIGLPAGESSNKGFTIYNNSDIDVMNQFAADIGIFEELSTTGNRTSNVTFEYNYWVETSGITDWSQIGLRLFTKRWDDYKIHLQSGGTTGTLNLTGDIANTSSASISMADLVTSYNSAADSFNRPADSPNRPWAFYNTPCTPYWEGVNEHKWGTLYNAKVDSVFRFCGNIFKGSTTSTNPGKIVFNNMTWVCPAAWSGGTTRYGYFSGTINVYAFDKTELRNYIRTTLLDFAPMKLRYNESKFNAYETALSNAMKVLANQKTTQKAVNDAYTNLKSAVETLQTTDNLINQVDELTHIQYVDDIGSEVAASTATRYVLVTLGEHTVPKKTEYVGNGEYKNATNKNSDIVTNHSKTDTKINIINYRYWNIDYSGIDSKIADLETAINNFDENLYKKSFKTDLENVKDNLEAMKATVDVINTPTSQEDIDVLIVTADNLIAHLGNNIRVHQWIEDDQGNYVAESDKDTHWYTCSICGYELTYEHYFVYENFDSAQHKVTCVYNAETFVEGCGYTFNENHIWVEGETVATSCTEGNINYSCVCGATKTEATTVSNHNFAITDNEDGTHISKCSVCGVIEPDAVAEAHTYTYVDNKDGTHTVTCSVCAATETVSHLFTNPELARPTLVDGVWVDGTYTYTCICGATKEEDAERADYSELEEVVDALEALEENENLNNAAKDAIADAIAKADELADNLVEAEQKQIDDLVKELQKVKADADEAIKNKELGVEKITEANSGVKVQFIDESGLGAIDSIQLGKDNGFIIRVANGNADSDITITKLNGEDKDITLASGESTDFNISADGLTAGIATYTITYTIDGLKDAKGNLVVFTTNAYLYVKAEAYNPYHLVDEDCANGSATSEWDYSLSTTVGDFGLVYINKAPKAEFDNDNLVNEKTFGLSNYKYYDYEDKKCYAGCTGTGETPYVKGDAHAATYRFYIDTSIAATWQEAGLTAAFAETDKSNYDNAAIEYVRLANNQTYLEKISGTDKTFAVTFMPGKSTNVPNMTWPVYSAGDMTVSEYINPDQNNYLFGQKLVDDGKEKNTAYVSFSGEIPQKTTEAKLMFSPRLVYKKAAEGFLGIQGAQNEAVTMTTHLYITSYDKAALREAVANAEQAGFNSEYFNSETYKAYEDALKTAKEVLGKAETNQEEVDKATAALNTAIENLNKADAEAKFILTVIHSIHENADKNSEATSTEYDYYLVNGDITPAHIDLTDMQINKKSDIANLTITEDTEYIYYYWYIDYSGAQDAIDAADAIINNTGYSDEYKQKAEDAKAALQTILNGKDATTTPESQSEVDDAIKAVTDLTGHTCADEDTDHDCDICGATMGTHADVDPKDHNCDYCGGKLTDCADNDKDHKCDTCGATMGTHADVDPKDHNCDYCGGKLTDCTDGNNDHNCDVCENKLTDCADSDNDHNCDTSGTELSKCADGNNDHNCDVCGKKLSDCSDVTTDNDHNCDICGKLGVTEHNYVNPVLTQRPTQNDDGTWNNGYYTSTCNCGDTRTTDAERANYTAYDKAVSDLNALLGKDNLTQAAKDKITAALEANDIADNLVKAEQPKVDAAAEALNIVLEEINAGIENGTYVYVDLSGYNNAHDIYNEKTEKVANAEDKDAVEAAIKTVTDANITATTTKAEGQTIVDAAAKVIADINAKYSGCADDNHTYEKEGSIVVVAPTCKENGYTTKTCDICGKVTVEVDENSATDHNYDIANAEFIKRPELVDGKWTTGKYEATCLNDAKHKLPLEGVERADYSAFDAAIAQIKEIAAYEKFTDEVKEAILKYAEDLESGKYLPLNLVADYTYNDVTIKGEQDRINAFVLELTKEGGVIDTLENSKNDPANLKPDYVAWEEAEGEYDSLDKTNVKADIIAEANKLKEDIDKLQKTEGLTQATATQDDIDDATARLNEIIAGIKDGSLKNPADFTEVNKDLAEAKDKVENNAVVDGVKEAIETIEDELEKLEGANADKQSEIDALEDQLEDIIAGIENGSLVKPDYVAWEEAEGEYDSLDKTNVKADIITEAEALKDTIAEKQEDKTLTQATATQDDIDDATARLNEIIEGIKDGSLKNPADFTEVNKDLAEAKDKAENNDVVDGVKEAIETIEDKLEKLEGANADKQSEIDALEDQLEDIIAGIENGSLVKPDYSGAESAIESAEKIESLTDEEKNTIENAKKELQAIKDMKNPEATKAENQDEVDTIKDKVQEIINKYADCANGNHDYADATCEKAKECKICGVTDGEPLDHIDTNNDHICNNGCGKKISECADGNNDHKCDVCKTTLSECADDNNDHNCDKCGTELSECTDNNKDHKCDICGTKLSDCSDVTTDNDHNCDICGKTGVTEHNYVNPVLTRPIQNNDGTWNDGYYTSTCNCGGTRTTVAERANYTTYDAAAEALNELLKDTTLTTAAINEIKNVLAANKIADNYIAIAEEQKIVNDAANALKVVLDKINGNKDAYVKPDFTDWNTAENNYDSLDKTNVKQEILDEVSELKNTINTLKSDPTANAAEDQGAIDDATARLNEIITEINGILNEKPDFTGYDASHDEYEKLVAQYGDKIKDSVVEDVADLDEIVDGVRTDETATKIEDQYTIDNAETELEAIIAGIKDGSLRDPDYSAVEDKLEQANNATGLNQDTQSKIDAIENALAAIKGKTEPEANAKDDQPVVDALEDQLDAILKDIADGKATAPDYSGWNTAESDYDALDKTNVRDEILDEVTELKNIINTLKSDPTANAAEDQGAIDEATTRLNEIITEINGILNEKPDFSGYDAARDEYEAIVEQYGDKIKDGVVEDVADLDEIVDGIRTDETATKIEDQDTIDDAETELEAIIAGIKDGSLRDPDYSAVEDKLEQANNATGLNQDTQSKIDAIENALAAIKGKTEPEANAKDDQPVVDALEDQLDAILKDISDGKATAPDYSGWNTAESDYDALDKTNVRDEILDEVTELKNTINTLKDDPTANSAEDQKTIDDATARLNEIIEGINDGSLLKPEEGKCDHNGTKKEIITKVEATCHSQGYTLYTCTACGNDFKGDFVLSLPHEFGEWRFNDESCDQICTKTRYCTDPECLAQETEYAFDENNKPIYGAHTLVVVPGKAATCVKDGYSDYTICINCNVVTESKPITATGHADNDKDGNCDKCRSVMDPTGHCSCLCHGDSFFEKLIYKIAKFFWKLFKMNEICECGATKHW